MKTLINLFDYQQAAREKLPETWYGYYASGAADEITLRENRAAFERIQLRPHVLVDVSQRNLETTIMGKASSMPVIVAPTALAQLAHPDGEVGIARAAKNVGITQCVSTLSNYSLEEVAVVGAHSWFQLYVYRDRMITHRLVERAADCGYQAIIVVVDTAVPGIRENLMRTGLKLPPGMRLKNFDEFHPTEAADVLPYVESQLDPSLTWEDLRNLVALSPVPVLVKGILRGDDAQRAIDCGAAGVIVSNHGGRQLDTAISSMRALPEVAAAVGDRAETYIDGGIRRGTDVLKALALGARAVMVGRPVLWGLAVGGQAGVEQVLRILQRELDTAMALCGCNSTSDISGDLVVQ